MKIIYIISGICIMVNTIYSQTFRNGYDNYLYNGGGHNQGVSFDINIDIPNSTPYALGAGENIYLESFITMYRATKDKKYLDLFIIHAFRIQTHRDDFVQNNIAGIHGTPCTNIDAYPHDNYPAWSRDDPSGNGSPCDGWVPLVLDNGNITYPMAEFVYLMQVEFANDADLQNTPVPAEALMSTIPPNNPYPNQPFNPYNTVATYSDFAEFLKNKIIETINYFESTWRNVLSDICSPNLNGTGGYYVKNWGNPSNPESPIAINMETAMGRTLIFMYLLPPNNIPQSFYTMLLYHITFIAQRFRCFLLDDPNDPSSYYWLDYDCVEDVNHATGVMSFADLCYQKQILNPYTSQLLFSLTDMEKFASAFVNHAYLHPLVFSNSIAGNSVNVQTCSGTTVSNLPGGNTFLSQYNPYVYQIISDVYSGNAIYGNESGDLGNESQLALYQHLFNPVAVQRGESQPVPSNIDFWHSCAKGDFNGDGKEDFVGVYNYFNGQFQIYTTGPSFSNPNNSNTIALEASSPQMGANNWGGIAAGDFNSNHIGDEFISSNGNDLYYFEQHGQSISPTVFNSILSAPLVSMIGGNFDGNPGDEAIGLDASGNTYMIKYLNNNFSVTNLSNIGVVNGIITTGSFDGTANEIAVVDNTTGYVQIFKIQNNTFSLLYQYTASAGNYNLWNGIAAGDFDGDGTDEIICHRDYDGQFLVFKVKNGQLVNQYGEYFPVDQKNGVMCAARLSVNSSEDALVTFRNYNGQITIFDMSGLCPGLNLTNQTINDATSINNTYTNQTNNYPIDYHVVNTLTAGNSFSISGSPDDPIVDFSAGKEIILTPGFTANAGCDFHAHIDQSLLASCDNNGNFRMANNNHIKTAPASDPILYNLSKPKTQSTTGLVVQPNPNGGAFTVTTDMPGTCKLLVCDVVGKVVYENDAFVGQLNIDISNFPKGIYFVKAICTDGNMKVQKLITQ